MLHKIKYHYMGNVEKYTYCPYCGESISVLIDTEDYIDIILLTM